MIAQARGHRSWIRWGAVLGFAISGFFDGILLHQILQWHHLLSLVPGMIDLRTQVLWDGYFHALMYVIAALGLWGLWRARRSARVPAGRVLAGALLFGFGLWHIVDGILSHWVLGIHRIRLDSENVLLWDLIWFVGFGVLPAAAGWLLLRTRRDDEVMVSAPTLVLTLGLLTALSAAWSLRAAPGSQFTVVAFAPGIRPAEVTAALREVEAGLVWSNPAMSVVVLDIEPDRRWTLYGRGALLVSGSGLPAGCLGWSRA